MAGMLLIAGGLLAILVTLILPANPPVNTPLLIIDGVVAIIVGSIAWRLPWHRWPSYYSHIIAVFGFGLISVGDLATSGAYRFNFFYVAAFTWVGLLHKRGTSLRFVPLFVAAYLFPAIVNGDSFGEIAAPFVYTLALCLLVGELIAWLTQKLQRLERDLAEQASAERFGVLVKYLSDIVVVINPEHRLEFISPSVHQVLGYPEEQLVGRNVLASLHPEDRQLFKALIARLLDGQEEKVTGELRFRHIDGNYRVLDMLAINALDNPHVGGLLFTASDITQQKAADTRLREAEERYRTLIEQLPAMTYIKSLDAEPDTWAHPWISPQAIEMFGYSPQEWERGINYVKEFVHPDDRARVEAQYTQRKATLAPFDCEYRVVTRSDRIIWVHDRAEVLHDAEGNPLFWQGIMFDVSDHKQLETQMEKLAYYDQLTGLPNRSLLLHEMKQLAENETIASNATAVLLLDLDHFKLINDSFGHSLGDRVISIVARRIQQVVGRTNLVARFGGDEFVILLTGPNATFMSNEIARRVIASLKDPIRIDDFEVSVTASVGIVHGNAGRPTPEDVIRDADVAMYEAKSLGRNQFVTFDTSMQDRTVARLMLESELRRALEEEQFELHYQPIVDLASGRVAKLETLLRWRHPERGLLSPAEFVPVAEETGQILAIGHVVLTEACRQGRAWIDALGEDAPIICVNLSAHQFLQPSLANEIQQIIQLSGIAPGHLELEITESAAMASPDTVVDTLLKLKALDVRIALDDFGTGYSGLSYLTQFPIDTLKIDRSFIAGMAESPEDLAIVRTILAFSSSLGLATVAEGIEHTEQRAQLIELGCDFGQGFHFARPSAAADIPGLLDSLPHTSLPPSPPHHQAGHEIAAG